MNTPSATPMDTIIKIPVEINGRITFFCCCCLLLVTLSKTEQIELQNEQIELYNEQIWL